ncbi:MAG TPA: NUDIX hydrolase [Candidatus Nanoarchaeia archaeon]|uniref:Nudix hydrolase domain-containing protein n=1 Tax=Candidatus Nomurabacteria bacterium RIFCSPHIGHO2_01_FULL_39_10 TaxID=1801733 RepID=A0A1F6V3E7_9BACT|nr:MAG: hypothetical protein A2642_04695 [Candidatus Nomurabacteria bacterium RIFCSPHIGHO2_01_FULL_39_10]HLD79986.1 NUDIX hydrolase [Candidatus Nanoarchaeia archaeon]
MAIKAWSKDGEPEIIAKGYGRVLVRQWFINPYTNERIDFTQFGSLKNQWPTIIMAITDKLEVLVVRQFRFSPNEITLEVPGGNPNPKFEDNSPIAVGSRELSEETGYTPREVIQLAPKAFFDPASYNVNYYPCLALGCYPTPEKKEDNSNEKTEVVLIPLKEYLKMMFNGEIFDSKTGHLLVMSLIHILGTDAEALANKILT